MKSYLVIGDGAAGVAAARAIRLRDQTGVVTIVSDDPNPHYFRAALTNYLLGQLRDEQLWGVPPGFYEQHRLGRFYGRVVHVDTSHSRVLLESGQELTYDKLVIASGATPNRLRIPGGNLHGLMTLRTLQDARRIVDAVPEIRHAVIVGGGTLGLEWVQGLRQKGVAVTAVIRERQLWPRFLDEEASEMVVKRLRESGVQVLMEDELAEARPGPTGHLGSVVTRSGREIACQLVGIAIGVSPNVSFLRDSGVSLDGGVWVDEQLRTNLETVFAAGDVAHIRRRAGGESLPPAGLWQPARKQGEIAGANACGERLVYQPGALIHATHLYDVDFAAVGEVHQRPGDQVVAARPAPGVYHKAIVRGGRVVGALMLGERSRIRTLKRLIDGALDVTSVVDRLLDSHFDLDGWIEREAPRQAARLAPPRPMRSEISLVVRRPPAQRRAAQEAWLVVEGRRYPIAASGETTIGRDPACAIPLSHESVSRKHARIQRDEQGFSLVDLGSTNGSWVGVTRLEPHVPRLLQFGDQLRFGRIFATFDGTPAPGEAPPLTRGVITGPHGTTVLVNDVTSFGRSPENDIVIPSSSASRLHAQIVRAEDGLYLYDLGSTNGTFVNGARLTEPRKLNHGDVIEIAHHRFTYYASPREGGTPEAVSRTITLTDDGTGQRYVLPAGETVIGRERSPEIAIVLAEPMCSRRHAAIVVEPAGATIRDLGSRNGTRVNGVLLSAPRRLAPGDVIQIGRTRLRVEGEEVADGA